MSVTTTWPTLNANDRRTHITASEFANSSMARMGALFADLKPEPDPNAGLDAQVLYGEPIRVLNVNSEWTKIASQLGAPPEESKNHYVGWVPTSSIAKNLPEPTHLVSAPRTFLYPEPDMKKPRCGFRSMGSLVSVVAHAETRGTAYAILSSGEAIIERHVTALPKIAPDYVSVAEQLIYAPYLWGGNTAFGIDCSGLVQLSMRMAGRSAMRDTDMQAATLGEPVSVDKDWQNLRRGDLVFWRGHVAIAQGEINGEAHLIHANGFTMDVTSEPARQAIERIAYLYEQPIGARRLG